MVRHAPNNNQRTAALFLSLGHHDTLIRRLHKAYRTRWEIMGAALQTHLPESARIPTFGGTSFWVSGPRSVDSEILAKQAAARGIVIESGRIHFGADNAPNNFFRLAFSSIEEKKIEPGIHLLADTIAQAQRQAAESFTRRFYSWHSCRERRGRDGNARHARHSSRVPERW
jgi:GntR family transcriptional regulator/MocR family aminotransferase